MMRYLLVRWLHPFPDQPIELYCEIDDAGYEVRKMEVFADGRVGFASAAGSLHETRLGDQPIPSLPEIAADPQFQPQSITRDEFEKIWANRFASKVSA